jgi:hypothetical protein
MPLWSWESRCLPPVTSVAESGGTLYASTWSELLYIQNLACCSPVHLRIPTVITLAHKIISGIINVPTARSMSDDMPDEERCSLCPSSGPILRLPDPEPLGEPSSNEDTIAKALVDPDSIPDLIWIACSKCHSWYHSHCILLDDESKRKSIPQAVMEELEKNFKDGWPFEDWTVWLNRWSVHSRCCGIKTNDQVL